MRKGRQQTNKALEAVIEGVEKGGGCLFVQRFALHQSNLIFS